CPPRASSKTSPAPLAAGCDRAVEPLALGGADADELDAEADRLAAVFFAVDDAADDAAQRERRAAVDEDRELALGADRIEDLRAHEYAALAEIARGRFDLELGADVHEPQLERMAIVAPAGHRIPGDGGRRCGAERGPLVVAL